MLSRTSVTHRLVFAFLSVSSTALGASSCVFWKFKLIKFRPLPPPPPQSKQVSERGLLREEARLYATTRHARVTLARKHVRLYHLRQRRRPRLRQGTRVTPCHRRSGGMEELGSFRRESVLFPVRSERERRPRRGRGGHTSPEDPSDASHGASTERRIAFRALSVVVLASVTRCRSKLYPQRVEGFGPHPAVDFSLDANERSCCSSSPSSPPD